MTDLTTEALFAYASGYAERSEKAGKGTQWPTIRQVKRRFRGASYGDVEDACANYCGEGYMGLGVGYQVGGLGGGTAYEGNANEHVVEAYL
jgi:hypothetical protein